MRFGAPPCDRHTKDRNREHGDQMANEKRIDALGRKQPPNHQLQHDQPTQPRSNHDRTRVETTVFEPHCDKDQTEEHKRERAQPKRDRSKQRSQNVAMILQRDQTDEHRCSTDGIGVPARKERSQRKQRKDPRAPDRRDSPTLHDQHRKAGGRGHHGEQPKRDRPNHLLREVRQRRVGDQRIVTGVPKVVPQHRVALHEQRAIEMSRSVVRERRQRLQQDRANQAQQCCDHRLPQDQRDAREQDGWGLGAGAHQLEGSRQTAPQGRRHRIITPEY